MYIVIYKHSTHNTHVKKFEYLDEAKDFLRDLVREGITDISLSKELPFKLKIEVEF